MAAEFRSIIINENEYHLQQETARTTNFSLSRQRTGLSPRPNLWNSNDL